HRAEGLLPSRPRRVRGEAVLWRLAYESARLAREALVHPGRVVIDQATRLLAEYLLCDRASQPAVKHADGPGSRRERQDRHEGGVDIIPRWVSRVGRDKDQSAGGRAECEQL